MIADWRTPLERLLRHEAAYWTSVSRAEERGGYTLFHNRGLAPRLDPNHAGVFRARAGSAPAIVAEIVAFYRDLGVTPAAYVDALATPHDLPAELLRAGFRELGGAQFGATDLLVYLGPDRERSAEPPVERVVTAAQRAAWAEVIEEDAEGEQRELLTRLCLAETADPRVTAFLARVDGRPAGRALLFSDGGLGRVEAVRTLEPYRGRGIAAACVRAAVAASLASGALTYLYAEQGGAAQRLYERLGFRTVARDVMRFFTYEP
jgi:ribosomal protein S18 acetylase RimI-like enzyme